MTPAFAFWLFIDFHWVFWAIHREIIFATKRTNQFLPKRLVIGTKQKMFSCIVHICDIVQLKSLLLLDIYLPRVSLREWFVIVLTFFINASVLNAKNYINVTLLLKFTHIKVTKFRIMIPTTIITCPLSYVRCAIFSYPV